MIISVLRKEARQNLKEKWKNALLIMLLFFITNLVITFVATWISTNTTYGLFANIISLVITVTLNYGLLASFIKLKRNEKVGYLHYIYYAGRDAEKVWKNIGRIILKLSFLIIALLLFLYLMVTEFVSLYNGYGMRLSYIIEILGVIGFSIWIMMKSLYYSLNNYILYDNKDYKAKEILKESERLMKNHRWDFVKMNLSFAGWFALGMIFSVAIILALFFVSNIQSFYLLYITYIPLIFLLPYIQITNICFYDNLLYNNPKPKDNETNKKKKINRKKQKKNVKTEKC